MTEADGTRSSDPWASLSVEERYRTSVGGSSTTRQTAVLAPFRRRLIATDALIIAIALAIGLVVSSRQSAWLIDPLLAIYGTPVGIGLLWLGLLFLRGSYDQRIIGLGPDEIRRILTATLYTFAVVAGVSYLIRADISRAYAYVSLPLGLVLMVALRFAWRRWLYSHRNRGEYLAKTVVVGNSTTASALADKLEQERYVGYQVAARVGLPAPTSEAIESWLDEIDQALGDTSAAVVAIDPGEEDPHDAVRQLAWRLEGRGIDLLISPGMLDLAGPRLSVRPAAGLPLLHLDEAALSRPQSFAKRTLDLLGSSALMVILSPVFIACAVAVKLSSPGPILFRQTRIGRAGRPFTMLKFRSMSQDADGQRESLRTEHQHHDPMFKLTDDPRTTPTGRFLRRWSLDELPQLINVLLGTMSLVGPRPHPLDDVDRYGIEAYRRLALKPGMTGLWQVEGRSDLSWSEALQLDLYYVERWSMAGDALLLARTARAVLQGRGAH